MKGIIEIFERKEQEEAKLNLFLKEERTEDKEKEIIEQKEILDSLNKQLSEEISNFKATRENDLLAIIKKFFRDKYDCNTDISQIFEGGADFVIKK